MATLGEDLDASTKIGYSFLCVALVLFAGLMSGLTLGLLSLDRVELEVLVRSGTAEQKRQAATVIPLVKKGHQLLVTLLLMNAAAMETLPIFLDKLLDPLGAILISVTMVLIFGEIVPQAICQRFGLAIGARLRWVVYGLMLISSPVSIPMARLLDRVLGVEEGGGLFRRAQLKALVDLHGSLAHGGHGGELTTDETTIISGALDMSHKTVAAVMTPLARVQGVALDTKLTWSALRGILACGHSRLPVHVPGDPTAIVGLLLVKELFAAVTLEDLTSADAANEGEGARTLLDAIKLRPIPRMNQATPLYTALNYFQTGRSHMAVVTAGATVLYLDSHSSAGAGAAAAAAAANHSGDGSSSSGPRLVRSRSGGQVASPETSPGAAVPPAARRSIDAAAAAGKDAPLILGAGDSHMLAPAKGVVGILTLEDVLEELLQEEILDETDRAEGDEHLAAALNDQALQTHISSPPPGERPPERPPSPPLLPISLLRRASGGGEVLFERLESSGRGERRNSVGDEEEGVNGAARGDS